MHSLLLPLVRPFNFTADDALRAILVPRRVVRWLFIGRVLVATGIFLATAVLWGRVGDTNKLIASMALATTLFFTAGSAIISEVQRRPLGRTFYYLQVVFDLVLVTAVVHITGGSESQFAALYILVIAAASLLLPIGGGLLIAAFGNVLYFADVIWGHQTPLDAAIWLQLGVFAVVALGSGYLSARLRAANAGTEELAAELVKARLQAADILGNIRSGVLTIDGKGRLLFANPAAAKLLALDVDRWVGKPFLGMIATVAPELARALERSVQERTRTTRAEGTIATTEGEFPIGVTTTYTEYTENDTESTPTTATAIFQDISDQKRLDDLHLRAERLEAVAELSASLAHEIKNPLASIRSAVEQLATRSGANEDERTLGTLIVRESDRLSRLLSEFLDFARVRVTKIERVDLCAVAHGAVTLAGQHPDRGAELRVTCLTPTDRLEIEGDEDLLHRAIFNLALNAVQAAPVKGQVAVEVASVASDQLPAGVVFEQGAVALRVSDDGPGIPPEIRDRLFHPFFTTKQGGTGLGLPVVHRAIEAHRGLVFVDSDRTGTRFTVLLPCAQPENGAGE